MITVSIFKKAIIRYHDELKRISNEKPFLDYVYELTWADEKDVLENNLFTFQLSKFIDGINRRHRDPNELLNSNELFILFGFLTHFKEYADVKALLRVAPELDKAAKEWEEKSIRVLSTILEDYKSNSDADASSSDSRSSSNHSPRLFHHQDEEFSSSTEEEIEEVVDLRQSL